MIEDSSFCSADRNELAAAQHVDPPLRTRRGDERKQIFSFDGWFKSDRTTKCKARDFASKFFFRPERAANDFFSQCRPVKILDSLTIFSLFARPLPEPSYADGTCGGRDARARLT